MCSLSVFLMQLLMPFISGLLCSLVSLGFYVPFIHLLLFKANISLLVVGWIKILIVQGGQVYLFWIKVFGSLDGLDRGVGWLKKLMREGGGAERWPARSEDKCHIVAAPDYGTDIFNSR